MSEKTQRRFVAAVPKHKVQAVALQVMDVLHNAFPRNIFHAITVVKAVEDSLLKQAEEIYGSKIELQAVRAATKEDIELIREVIGSEERVAVEVPNETQYPKGLN